MNKLAAKQARQTKVPPGAKREKKLSKQVCKCSGKKHSQPKVILGNQDKIKKVASHIRSICMDSTLQPSGSELSGRNSDQSVVYIGTYPKQPCSIIDLTTSSSSLENNDNHCIIHNSFSPQNYKVNLQKALYLPHFKTAKISLVPRLTKSATLATLPVIKSKSAAVQTSLPTSGSSVLLNENRSKFLQKLSVLDIPPDYATPDASKDFKTSPGLDECDHEIMNMVLDMEDDYQLFYNGSFDPEAILEGSSRELSINKLIEKYK